jgi:TRAP-type mannitol/chloroaromatic compound transport system permease small subunit
MHRLLRVAYGIDRFSERTGRGLYWLTLIMVLLGAGNAVVRYLDRYTGLGIGSNLFYELQWYLFAALFLLGGAYVLRHNAHVRVDVFYSRLSPRGKAWVNLLGTVLFLIPFCTLMIWTSWPAVRNSWLLREMSPDPGGLPRYPIKTVVPVAFALLLLQGAAVLIKQVAVIKGILSGDEMTGKSIDNLGEAV